MRTERGQWGGVHSSGRQIDGNRTMDGRLGCVLLLRCIDGDGEVASAVSSSSSQEDGEEKHGSNLHSVEER